MTDHPTCGPDADAPQVPPASGTVAEARKQLAMCAADAIGISLVCEGDPRSAMDVAFEEVDALIAAVRAATLADVERVVEGLRGVVPIAHDDSSVSLDDPWGDFPTWVVRRADVLAAIRAMRTQ